MQASDQERNQSGCSPWPGDGLWGHRLGRDRGITLGGGVGYLVRKHGLTFDNLVAAEIVTAGGQLLRADATADMVKTMPYPQMYKLTKGAEVSEEAERSFFLDRVDVGAAEAIVHNLRTSSSQMAVAQIRVLGGAMARVPAEATAFAHRGRRIMAAVGAVYECPEEAPVHEAWVRAFAAALRQGEPGVYVNFLGNEGEGRIREAYPGPTWERLVAIKGRYDPTNLFRLNQNIRPEARPACEAVT